MPPRGTNFTSKLFNRVKKRMGVARALTTAYHPQTDGVPEKLNRFIVMALYAFVDKGQRDWDTLLPSIAFAYRTSVVEGVGFTPFMLLQG